MAVNRTDRAYWIKNIKEKLFDKANAILEQNAGLQEEAKARAVAEMQDTEIGRDFEEYRALEQQVSELEKRISSINNKHGYSYKGIGIRSKYNGKLKEIETRILNGVLPEYQQTIDGIKKVEENIMLATTDAQLRAAVQDILRSIE